MLVAIYVKHYLAEPNQQQIFIRKYAYKMNSAIVLFCFVENITKLSLGSFPLEAFPWKLYNGVDFTNSKR